MRKRFLRSFFFVLCGFAAVAGQRPAEDQDAEKLKAERRTRLIASLSREATELTLPENRASLAARLGAAIWKDDPERAGTLFRTAVASLIAAQDIAEANRTEANRSHDLLQSQSVRPNILNSIAVADAEFALESLYRTRPTAIQKALVQRTPGKLNNVGSNYMYLAQQEINLEQRLIRMVAEQKPERAIELLKDSIRKRLSHETLSLLKKLWEKEPAAANELANGVVDRLISMSFTGPNNQINHDLFNISNSILGEFVRQRPADEKGIVFDESRMRSLAQKVIAGYLEHGARMGYIPISVLEPIARRLASPVAIVQLKKVAESNRNHGHYGGPREQDPEYAKLMATNPTAETLMAEAKRFPPETRRPMYQNAANKLTDTGQYERAIALLDEQFEDDALEHAISSLNWYYAHLLVRRREFDAAEAMMMQFNDSNRISALTSLATTIFQENQKENRPRAVGLLQRVRSLLPEKPETSTDYSQLFQLVGVMATIEPNEAFRNLEPVVHNVNQLTEAWAVVNGFQGGNVRRGEYVITGGYNLGVHIDVSIFRTLAQNDFSRTMTMIDGFSRREMRIMILLGLLESGI